MATERCVEDTDVEHDTHAALSNCVKKFIAEEDVNAFGMPRSRLLHIANAALSQMNELVQTVAQVIKSIDICGDVMFNPKICRDASEILFAVRNGKKHRVLQKGNKLAVAVLIVGDADTRLPYTSSSADANTIHCARAALRGALSIRSDLLAITLSTRPEGSAPSIDVPALTTCFALPSIPRTSSTAHFSSRTRSWESLSQTLPGTDAALRILCQALHWPLAHSATLHRLNIRCARGVLLHGPPGCSKTSCVRAACSAARLSMHILSPASVYSMYVGEAERVIRDTFASARALSPSVVFIDEIDAIAGTRNGTNAGSNPVSTRVLATLLAEMDGVQNTNGVVVLAATNRIRHVDEALLRPGRFDHVIKMDLPDESTRERILQVCAKDIPVASDVDFAAVAKNTPGSSPAHLAEIVREAARYALTEAIANAEDAANVRVQRRHFAPPT